LFGDVKHSINCAFRETGGREKETKSTNAYLAKIRKKRRKSRVERRSEEFLSSLSVFFVSLFFFGGATQLSLSLSPFVRLTEN